MKNSKLKNKNLHQTKKKKLKFITYKKKYDETYLNPLIEKATKNWSQIKDKDVWLRQIKGNYD